MNNQNNIKLHLLIFVMTVTSIGCQKSKVDYPEPLTQLHQNTLNDILETPVDFEETENYLLQLKKDGSWPDIDYTSKERGSWPTAGHLSRLREIARAYQTKESGFYQKKKVSEAIHLGLNYWLDNDFQCPNWWYPEIGVPMSLAPVMILMEAELSAEQMQKGIKILNRSKIGMTGQNKVWQSGNVLLRNLLLRNEDTIRFAAESIQEELVVSIGEGVQPDWSYHQHGPQLQFGNYGLAYVGDMIKWISVLRNTPFQFDENKVEILRSYLLEGQQWVTWKGQMDISACGRQLFPDSPEQKAKTLNTYFKKMELLDPEFKNDFRNEYKKEIADESLLRSKHFWRSDFHVHRTPDYYFSVKMCSERVIGAESCNSENVQGYYMGDGATFLYQTGEEYRNIFPFWDWKKIPGTTIQQDTDTLPVLTARGYRIKSDFVGGTVGSPVYNSQNSIAAMQYDRNGLQARKSWFMFNDMIVCLGAGITSKEELPVTTSVNQSFLNGDVLIKTAAEEKVAGEVEVIKNTNWILHNDVGYFFPGGSKTNLSANIEKGSWHWVANRYPEELLHAKIFKLWLEHGTNPKNESYEYILVPKATKAKLEELKASFPFKIKNGKNKQEVSTIDGSSAGIVFYEPGKSDILGGIEVDKPCIVMISSLMNSFLVRIADPTQKLNEIKVKIDKNWQVKQALADELNVIDIQFLTDEKMDKSFQFILEKK